MYCTQLDVERRIDPVHLAELADDNSDGVTDSEIIQAAITDADATIDTYLSNRYQTPLANPPALVRKLSIDLAIAALFNRRREGASPTQETRAKLALELLSEIAHGEVVLPTLDNTAVKKTVNSTTLDQQKQFSKHRLAGF
jgi:phage gp36-like protein